MPTRKLYIPIAGTWARRGAKTTSWYRRRSSFDARLRGMATRGSSRTGTRPGQTPGTGAETSGGPYFKPAATASGPRAERTWSNLTYCLCKFPTLEKARVVTVDMPVRRDMDGYYATALETVDSRWTHLYSKRTWKFWKTWPQALAGLPKLSDAMRRGRVSYSKSLRCAPHSTLGRRRGDGALQPHAAVPAAPSGGARGGLPRASGRPRGGADPAAGVPAGTSGP